MRTNRPGLILAIGCLLSIVLALPALRSPVFADDAVHRAMLTGRVPAGLHWGPLQLYEFVGGAGHPAPALRDLGILPWFTADDLKLRFFRPLSSATLAADQRLFGRSTWPGRLHSLLWFLGLLCLVAAVHRRCVSPTSARVATLLFAVAGAHAVPISWMAARHVLVSSVCALLAFWLHLRSRQDGRRPERWLSLVAVAAGLGAGEMALGTVGLIAAYEGLGRRDSIAGRVAAAAPAASIAALYVGAYVATGHGAHGSGGYVGLESNVASALVVARHFCILVGELAIGFPSDALTLASAPVQSYCGDRRCGVRAGWCGPPQGVSAGGRRERSRAGMDGARGCTRGNPRQLRDARRPCPRPRAGACERRRSDRARRRIPRGAHPRVAPARPARW